jgi:hypothetical protein
LQSAWTKYGESAFRFEIIKQFQSLEELNSAEIDVIRNGTDLYNLSDGGNGYTHNETDKKVIGEANKRPVIGMNIKTGEIREYASATDAKIDGFNQACIRKCAKGFISTRKDGSPFKSISHKGWVWMEKEISTCGNLKNYLI